MYSQLFSCVEYSPNQCFHRRYPPPNHNSTALPLDYLRRGRLVRRYGHYLKHHGSHMVQTNCGNLGVDCRRRSWQFCWVACDAEAVAKKLLFESKSIRQQCLNTEAPTSPNVVRPVDRAAAVEGTWGDRPDGSWDRHSDTESQAQMIQQDEDITKSDIHMAHIHRQTAQI